MGSLNTVGVPIFRPVQASIRGSLTWLRVIVISWPVTWNYTPCEGPKGRSRAVGFWAVRLERHPCWGFKCTLRKARGAAQKP